MMHIDTKLSSDSNADQGNPLREFDYVNAVGGYAFLFAVVVFFTTLSSCCKKYTIKPDSTKSASNVTEDDHHLQVMTARRHIGNEHRCSSETSVYRPRSSSATQKGRSTDTFPLMNMMVFPKPRGLINNGNTCYFNSVMQALAQTTILEIRLSEIKNPGNMIKEILRFYVSIHGSETSAFSPQRLQRLMFKRTGKFDFGIQHDSHECLLNILHELKKDEGQGRVEQLTMVDKIFGGHTMTVYVCNECGTPSHLCEPYLDISLPIWSSSPRKSRRQSSEKRPHSGIKDAPKRPLPSVDGAKQGNREEHKASDSDIVESGSDFESRENRSGERKRTTAGRSRERSPRRKVRKRNSEFTSSELSQLAVSKDPEPTLTQQEAYRRAVSSMMRTPARGRAPSDLCTLDDCLRCYTRKEHIVDDYLCRECNSETMNDDKIKLTSATKQTLIFNPPAVLTFHLKRFEVISGKYVKQDTMVHYKEVLDIGPYYTGWWNNEQNQNVWYSLYAVVVHSGSLQWGHYIAYVKARRFDEKIAQFLQKTYIDRDNITVERLIDRMKDLKSREHRPYIESPVNKEGTWYCVNDHKVTKVLVEEALDQKAFLLFYERL